MAGGPSRRPLCWTLSHARAPCRTGLSSRLLVHSLLRRRGCGDTALWTGFYDDDGTNDYELELTLSPARGAYTICTFSPVHYFPGCLHFNTCGGDKQHLATLAFITIAFNLTLWGGWAEENGAAEAYSGGLGNGNWKHQGRNRKGRSRPWHSGKRGARMEEEDTRYRGSLAHYHSVSRTPQDEVERQ